MANEVKTPIPARIYNAAVGGHVAGTEDIYDDTKGKTQKQINTEVEQSLGSGGSVDSRIQNAVNNEKSRAEGVESSQAERITTLENAVGSGGSVDERIATEGAKHYLKSETYTKDEVHGLITTPNQQYITVTATAQTTAVTDLLPTTGAADTIYRVGNWDGSQFDASVYSEYAWNSSQYVHLSTKTKIGEVFDISAYHATGGTLAKYADLTAALDGGNNIPQELQMGGMSVKFVQSSDNKYVQCRLTTNEWSTNTADWAIADEGIYVDNSEFVRVETDSKGRILWAIKTDGSIYYGAGVPQQVIDYINEKIAELSLDEYENIVAFLNDLEKGDKTLQTLLNEKVDKVAGKSLIDNEYANGVSYVENPEFVKIVTDYEGKILYAVKTDGSFVFGAGVPQQVIDYIEEKISSLSLDEYEDIVAFLSDYLGRDTTLKTMIDGINARIPELADFNEYIQVTTDSENKILEGITKKGVKRINIPIDTPSANIEHVENPNWLEVKTDNNGKLIEGVRKDGSKFIGQFDAETEKIIKNLTENSGSVINIPVLDADFDTNLPYKVYNGNVEDNSVKGTDAAKYVFDLGVQENKDWIVRFKFRMTENIFNQERNAIIANIGLLRVTAIPIPLTQHQEQFEYEGVMQTENWPTYDGGIVFNYNSIDNLWENRNLGKQSFSVRYTGSGDIVTLENDGNGLILTVDGNITTYTFANYANVSELYAAMSANNELALQFISIDHRTCDELAKFGPIRLKDTFYVNEDGTVFDEGNEHPVEDNAPLFLRYAVPDNWFQVEMFKKGGKVYCICDGKLTTIQTSYVGNQLVLGGDCGVLFKDFVFCDNNTLDTEIVNGKVVSSVNPSVIIFECHGMYDGPSYTVTPQVCPAGEAFNSANPDSMEYFFSDLEKKGYLPVSIEDIASYYTAGTPLPKRCYVHIFDDRRWQICLNNELRRVFSRHNATPALAMITDVDPVVSDIIHNGETITKKQAVGICKAAGFNVISHTAKHRNVPRSTKPSDQEHFFEQDLYNADDIYANGSILVYPGGDVNVYNQDVMEFVGFKLGIEIYHKNNTPNYRHNRFMLSRVNIGRIIYNTGEFYDYDYYTDLII